jgi:hypothetical protein
VEWRPKTLPVRPEKSAMPIHTLADKIRDKILAGALPRRFARTWTGYGDSRACAGCNAPIFPAQVEDVLEPVDGLTFRLHLGCHGLWHAELLQAERLPKPARRRAGD